MKTFKEYLAESKKLYGFKIKVAGEVPEKFSENLKQRLDRCGVNTLDETVKTPVQRLPIDFPELKNVPVTVFSVICEYPITSPEIESELKEMGMDPCCFRVRGAGEPTEVEQEQMLADPSGKALLQDTDYSEMAAVEYKNYFGDDFNASFLQELAKTAKERNKELGHDSSDPDVLGSAPKVDTDKAGAKSAMGS